MRGHTGDMTALETQQSAAAMISCSPRSLRTSTEHSIVMPFTCRMRAYTSQLPICRPARWMSAGRAGASM